MAAEIDEGPQAVIGNLRFTADGVYAEYLVSGRPFIFLLKDAQNQVADLHADMHRTLPSGAILSGLTAPVSTKALTRRMIFAHPDLHPDTADPNDPMPAHTEDWIRHCELWKPVLAAAKSRKPVFWLQLPLDYGQEGATNLGSWQRRLDSIIGRDKDSDESLEHYRELAARMVSKLPPGLFAKPAAAEQIWWNWNYVASRHTFALPLPNTPYDPHARLDASAFTPVWKDPSAAALHGRRWRAARTEADVFVRTFREPGDRIADSYQAIVGLEKFPDAGIQWPHATIFKMLNDMTTPATTLDWAIHYTFDSAEVAVNTAHNTILNIRDQGRQRGRHAFSDDELRRREASGRQLASALKQGSAERGVNVSVVVVAASPSAGATNAAINEVIRRFRGLKVETKRRKGSQVPLSRAFVPGSESHAALHEIRNPSTTEAFAKFVPLTSTSLGNNVGVPIGYTITSPGVPELVFNDLLGAPGREHAGNLVIGGSPGRGKSKLTKNLVRHWLALGAGVHLMDPTEAREHQRALESFPAEKKTIIDAKRPHFSLDPVRIFSFEEAAERAVDHLLPQMGFAPMSPQSNRLKGLLDPAARTAYSISTLNRLINFLADRRRPERVSIDDDLLVALQGMRAEALLAPMFDESLPVPDLSAQLVIWNFGGLKLPTVTEEYQAHLHHQSTPSRRAAQALYGLAAELAESLFFSRPTQPDVLVVEECAAWTHSPGGQRCANTLIRQGRKAWTQFVAVSQSPRRDFGVLEDDFIRQRMCLGFETEDIAEDTLRWCRLDIDRHPKLLADYVNNTSPAMIIDHGDDTIDSRHGKVMPRRHGEAWCIDEFGRLGKVKFFPGPTPELITAYDTNPLRERIRRRQAAQGVPR